jgi:hypothetical protein
MSLKAKIQEELMKSLKEKDELKTSVFRLLLASLLNKEKEKRYKTYQAKPDISEKELVEKSQLTDEEIIEVISSEIKKRREAALGFEKGKRQDLVDKEKKEAEILKRYLPEQMSEEEIRNLVKEVIATLRASLAPSEREKFGIKDLGKVMSQLMPKVKGKADGTMVSSIVKESLS